MSGLKANRGQPPGESGQIGSDKIVISEFGDGIMGPAVGQRSGFIAPWPLTLGNWLIWSTGVDGSGDVVPVAVTAAFRGWWKGWVDAAYTEVTLGFDPSVTALAQNSGTPAGWTQAGMELADQWEWQLVSLSGGGSKLYIAQGITRL